MHVVDVCALYTPHGGGVKTYVEPEFRAPNRHGVKVTIRALGKSRGKDAIGIADIHSVPGRRFPFDGPLLVFQRLADSPSRARRDDSRLRRRLVALGKRRNGRALAWCGAARAGHVCRSSRPARLSVAGGMSQRSTFDRSVVRFWDHRRPLYDDFDLVVCASEELTERLIDGGVTTVMGVVHGTLSSSLRDRDSCARLLAAGAYRRRRQCCLEWVGWRRKYAGRWFSTGSWRRGPNTRWANLLINQGRGRAADLAGEHMLVLAPIADRSALAQIMAIADRVVHGCETETFCMVASKEGFAPTTARMAGAGC